MKTMQTMKEQRPNRLLSIAQRRRERRNRKICKIYFEEKDKQLNRTVLYDYIAELVGCSGETVRRVLYAENVIRDSRRKEGTL